MLQELFRKKPATQVIADAASGNGDGESTGGMHRHLTLRDLTAFGIAAIVGAGIFSTIGTASAQGGPGIILLFLFVAVACGFSALCYAEFASMVPVSGSAYTYSYVAFGELIAWIIGWDLLMEYAIGNIAVAISWSDYFTTLLHGFQLTIPHWMTMDYWTAQAGATPEAVAAWNDAPVWMGIRCIADVPAFFIVILITWITYRGIRETRNSANLMVLLKLIVILAVIAVGAFYVRPEHWSPFLPNGLSGVLKGTAAVFFAYIGFDAISTTAEECKDPQRDLPRGMIYSLIICTVIYCLIALVLTGMVPYHQLNVGDPLAYVFSRVELNWMAGIVAVSAVIATASVLLVFQVGQPRIWMSMSRDGLLGPVFSRLHPVYKTPSFSTLLTGAVVAVPALFMNLNAVIELTSVGTLFAFVLVCGGVLRLQTRGVNPLAKFRFPYYDSRLWLPVLWLLAAGGLGYGQTASWSVRLSELSGMTGWEEIRTVVPYVLFAILLIVVSIQAMRLRWSLIPVLGLLSCSYLLCESGVHNWERFLLWLLAGFVVYFSYGYWHSKLRKAVA